MDKVPVARRKSAALALSILLGVAAPTLVACDNEDMRDVEEGVNEVEEGAEDAGKEVEDAVDDADSDGKDD